jgi:signal transduction histidine kinase
MILRLLNPQGIAGLAASFALAILLVLAKAETHHWKKQSAQFERLYRAEQGALAGTVANYRAAAEQAQAADEANAERVAAEQRSINQRSAHDFETRLAAARTAAQRLRAGSAPADPRSRAGAPVPGLAAATAGAAQAAGQDGLPDADALIATEQAIQLDELIKWVRAQAKVDNSAPTSASPPQK